MGRKAIDWEEYASTHPKNNMLTLDTFDHTDEKGRPYFEAICDCGNRTIVRHDNFISGHTKSCGCKKREDKIDPSDIVHIVINENLWVDGLLKEDDGIPGEKYSYLVTCKLCGTKFKCGRTPLISGHRKSCGCLQEKFLKENNDKYPSEIPNMPVSVKRRIPGTRQIYYETDMLQEYDDGSTLMEEHIRATKDEYGIKD